MAARKRRSRTSSVSASKSTTWARLTRTRTASGRTSSSTRGREAPGSRSSGSRARNDPRGLEELLRLVGSTRSSLQQGIGQPRVIRGELAANGSISARKRRPMFPKPTKPTRLPGEEKCVQRGGAAQPALTRRPHRPGPPRRGPGSTRAQAQAPSPQTASANARAAAEHADPALEAQAVVELGRPAAGHGEDRPEAPASLQHVAVPPARRHERRTPRAAPPRTP